MSELDAQIVGAFGKPLSCFDLVLDSVFKDRVCRNGLCYLFADFVLLSDHKVLVKETGLERKVSRRLDSYTLQVCADVAYV